MLKGAFHFVIRGAFGRVFGEVISGAISPSGLYVDADYVDADYVE